jgi:hypothetical protein
MHFRRFACLLLGAWMTGSLFMMWVATQNLETVDRVIHEAKGRAAEQIQEIGREPARLFLRHLAAEQNRLYFQGWEQVQLIFGVLLLLILFFGTDARPPVLLGVLLMTIVVALMHWLMTPEIIKLGRAIEFVPDARDSVARSRFWGFHTAYATIDVIKTVMAALIAIRLMLRRRRRDSDDDLDAVDDADHTRVDR